MADLIIKDLHVSVEGKEIIKGINLELEKGKVAVIMGPNGSGKSTLAYTLMGHPKYKIEKGEIIFKGANITNMEPNERAKLGLFLSFQYPIEVSGVSVANFLRTALNSLRNSKISVGEFRKLLIEKMELLNMDKSFMNRYLNDGFSGGEKKRSEILQLAVLQPEYAILDETDSGLDIDALKSVANGVNKLISPNTGVLLVTHYQRILNYIKPDKVYVMLDGKIIIHGNHELANQLEEKGYSWLNENSQEIQPN